MNINVSFTSSIDIKENIGVDETCIDSLFEEVVCFVLKNEAVKANAEVKKILEKGSEKIEASLYLCDNKEIQELNSKYRNIDRPTDVLSFLMADDNEMLNVPVLHLGEVIISVEKLVEQAKENNYSNLEELVFLITHGVLHLLGMHHDDEQKYNTILDIQNRAVQYLVKKVSC